MTRRLLVIAAILTLTLLSHFQFPGHTYLQADTQIYAPILEHLYDRSVLSNDILVRRPHVSFTVYDEVTNGIRHLTGWDLETSLEVQQLITRALGIWGVYLIALAFGLPAPLSLLVAAIFSLGATILGPAVLSFEYEPNPRAFAVPLLILATGLAANGRDLGAGIAGAAAFLIHPPTVYPFWGVFFCLVLWPSKPDIMERRLKALGPLLVATIILLLASRHQAGVGETQVFFARLDAMQEQLQRFRGSYAWVSIWWRSFLPHHLILFAASLLAYWRIRKSASLDTRFFLIGLPLIGLLSMPASYLLLEKAKWALLPQFQPMRALLFLTTTAGIAASIAACKAIESRRILEGIVWFGLAYLIPANVSAWPFPVGGRLIVIFSLAMVSTLAAWLWSRRPRLAVAVLAAAILIPFYAVPNWAKIRNYPHLHTPELSQLSQWALRNTAADAMFLFPDAKQGLDPGIFRARTLRAVYVDWKGGGQINYLKELGMEWWSRWQDTMNAPVTADSLQHFRELGIDYVVLKPVNKLAGITPCYANSLYVVYGL